MILLISSRYSARADVTPLIETARENGIEVCKFLNSWSTHEQTLSVKKRGAIYGEHAFAEFAAEQLGWNLYQNSPDWITKLPQAFLKRNVKCYELRALKKLEQDKKVILGKKFLEPADEPCFQPGIYDKFPNVPPDTLILAHTVQDWKVKYRFVIVNQKIVTYCCYKLLNMFNDPVIWDTVYLDKQSGVTAPSFVQTLLNHNNCAPSCVIDVGFAEELGWSVVGTYPIWAASIYGCNPNQFLKGIFSCCEN